MTHDDKIEILRETIEKFAKGCYLKGKMEILEGIVEDNSETWCQLPREIFHEIIMEIKKEEPQEQSEIGFTLPQVMTPKIEEEKKAFILSIEKEAELIKKYGKKKMERLAKQINFHGILLNKKNDKKRLQKNSRMPEKIQTI